MERGAALGSVRKASADSQLVMAGPWNTFLPDSADWSADPEADSANVEHRYETLRQLARDIRDAERTADALARLDRNLRYSR